jgi:hypothetical protein
MVRRGSGVRVPSSALVVDPDVQERFIKALRRDAVLLLLVYLVPPLRRWKHGYWRLTAAALVVGAIWGLAGRFLTGADEEAVRSQGAA